MIKNELTLHVLLKRLATWHCAISFVYYVYEDKGKQS